MILITGGAGYIGSHTNKYLARCNFETIIYDNLVYGNRDSVRWGSFILGDLSNMEALGKVFDLYPIEAVIHFAAFAYVGESVLDPEKYYFNNVTNTLNLLKVMREKRCKRIIFSSTCATYGNPVSLPIDERHSQIPINPYGRSKLMVENILKDYSDAYGIKYISLRYFNAAGADPECEIGEMHNPETHLIPLVIDAALGKLKSIKVFGSDYLTADGSAVRDYIHVSDIANAHRLALEYLIKSNKSDVFNLGNGEGYSVFDVIESVKRVSGIDFPVEIHTRRPGDPPVLIGDSRKIKKILKWDPQYCDLDVIVKTALSWAKKVG
jgi:UDP-glucose 4-epimerase